jgi:hypothetical protein
MYYVTAASILVAIAIAAWQFLVARRYRKIDRAERAQLEAKRAEDLALAHRRQANRDSWDQEYQEYRGILTKLEDIASAVEEGPLTPDQTDGNELGRVQRRLNNVSTRCPEALREPLRKVAEAVGVFRGIQILSEADATKEYSEQVASKPTGCPDPLVPAKKIGAKAIAQYAAAVKLLSAIDDAWKALNTERGESLVRSLNSLFRCGGPLNRELNLWVTKRQLNLPLNCPFPPMSQPQRTT